MKSVGIPGFLGMSAGAMLAAALIPLTVAAPARAGTVNEFFINSDPELGLGVPNAIEDIFISPWGDFSYVIPDDFMPLVSG